VSTNFSGPEGNDYGQLSQVGQLDTGEIEASSQVPVSPRKDSISLLEGLAEFLLYMREERKASPATLDAYERDLLRFATALPGAGDGQLRGVASEDIRDHMHVLITRGLSPATVRRALYAIASFFGWAHKWDLVAGNPSARVTVPRRERVREVRSLSKRERALVLGAADQLARESPRHLDSQAPLLVRLLMRVGLRRGEALDLAWRDVYLARKEIVVRYGKGGKSRRIPIEDGELLELLREAREERGIGDGANDEITLAPVLFGAGGAKISRRSLYRLFHRVLAVAGLTAKGITPHSLRHTFGTVLCDRGVPVPYVKELLGHEDIGSTMVYVHSTPVALRAAIRKLRE
jgi:site-specific recombinase XerD